MCRDKHEPKTPNAVRCTTCPYSQRSQSIKTLWQKIRRSCFQRFVTGPAGSLQRIRASQVGHHDLLLAEQQSREQRAALKAKPKGGLSRGINLNHRFACAGAVAKFLRRFQLPLLPPTGRPSTRRLRPGAGAARNTVQRPHATRALRSGLPAPELASVPGRGARRHSIPRREEANIEGRTGPARLATKALRLCDFRTPAPAPLAAPPRLRAAFFGAGAGAPAAARRSSWEGLEPPEPQPRLPGAAAHLRQKRKRSPSIRGHLSSLPPPRRFPAPARTLRFRTRRRGLALCAPTPFAGPKRRVSAPLRRCPDRRACDRKKKARGSRLCNGVRCRGAVPRCLHGAPPPHPRSRCLPQVDVSALPTVSIWTSHHA